MIDRRTGRADDEPTALALRLADQPGVKLGELLTGLLAAANEPIQSKHLDTRARTTLRRLRCSTWGDLAKTTASDILSVPSSGRLTVSRILTAAASFHLEVLADSEHRNVEAVDGSAEVRRNVDIPPGFDRLRDLLQHISGWAVRDRGATKLSDLIRLSPDLGRVPPELSEEFRRLSDEPIEAFTDSASVELSPRLPEELIEDAETRTDILLRRRVNRGRRPTLESVGDEIGVTRERVRQLEVNAAREIAERLGSPCFAPLRWRASDLADVLGPAVPADSELLEAALAWATRGFDDPSSFLNEDLMLWIAGPYEPDSGWLVRKGVSLSELVAAFDTRLGEGPILAEQEARSALDALGLDQTLLEPLMALTKSWREIDQGTWVRWTGAVGDKAEVVLRLIGQPCAADEINAFIGEGHAVSSLRNAMAADDRFVRVDKAGKFALSAWGLEEYSGIANEMLERIQRAQGPVGLDDLIHEFVSTFGVSENSVRMYAAAPAFVLDNGRVRLRSESEPYEVDRRIERVPGLYVRPTGEVVLHDIVDRDVLRGSGRAFPEAAAAALGVMPGNRAAFLSDDGEELVISWPRTATTGPSIGSTRRIAESLSLKVGDRFRIILDADHHRFVAEIVDPSDVYGLTGMHVEPGRELEMLASGMRTTPNAVRAHLRARNEHDVLRLLPEYDSEDELGQAISDFGSLLD
jgi:hypothetical protein